VQNFAVMEKSVVVPVTKNHSTAQTHIFQTWWTY